MLASMKLRHLLIGLFTLLALIAFLSIGWNIRAAQKNQADANWLEAANTLGDTALRVTAGAGMERGLTVLLLALPRGTPHPPGELARLAQLRAENSAMHETLLGDLRTLERIGPPGFMRRVIERFDASERRLQDARRRVDACLAGTACTLGNGEWLEVVNAHIGAITMLRRMALSSRSEDEHPYADNPLMKEILFTLTEYAGRERALVGGVIAAGRPFTVSEMATVQGYRGIIAEATQRADMMVTRMQHDPGITAAREAMRKEFQGRYEVLRQHVYDASARAEPYPVSAAHWYHASTSAINSIVELSNRLGAHARADIADVQNRMAHNVLVYVANGLLVLAVFAAILFAMYQRALLPLRRLEQAARTIAGGDLQQPISGFRPDELGDVAGAFERMRASLLQQMDERARVEAQLQASTQRFRGLVENLSDVIWEVGRDGRYTYISPQVRALLGYDPAEVLGKTPLDLMPEEEAERLREFLAGLLERPRPFQGLRNAARHRAGRRIELETSGVPVFDAEGALAGYRGVDRDITWRVVAEEEAARMLRVIEQTDDLVTITNPTGIIQYVNAAFERVTGYTRGEAIGQHTRILKSGQQDEAFYRNLWRTITSGASFQATMIDRRKNGEFFRTEKTISPLRNASGVITHYVCTAKDVTERHRLDEQLRQSEKLASIGQLAAGVAHEINNPVGYISSNLNTLGRYADELFRLCDAYVEAEAAITDTAQRDRLRMLKEEVGIDYLRDDVRDIIAESSEGVQRVKRIVQDLKDFSRQEAAEWQMADLHKGLESTLNIVHNEIKYKADVVREYGDLPEVECVPSQLNQVFMNLLINAAHAIEQRGTITVRTGEADDEVWVEVADTGQGIAPENLKHIFDPFFTTKPVGKGTGLGLALTYGIVQKHGGRIEVDSEPGRGTRFRVWLPVTQPQDSAAPA